MFFWEAKVIRTREKELVTLLTAFEIAYQAEVIKLGWNLARKKCQWKGDPPYGRWLRSVVSGCCVNNNNPKNI